MRVFKDIFLITLICSNSRGVTLLESHGFVNTLEQSNNVITKSLPLEVAIARELTLVQQQVTLITEKKNTL